VLVDDHDVVRQGVRSVLETQDDIVIVAEAATVPEALTTVDRHRPDVVVMDIALGDSSGIDLTRDILRRWPETKVLMLTGMPDETSLVSSIKAGARGYLLKQIALPELVDAVRAVDAGQHVIDKRVTGLLLAQVRASDGTTLAEDDGRLDRLTAHERHLLGLVAQGRTNRQIGEIMDLKEKTIRNYVSTILGKLGLESRTQAAAYLLRREPQSGRRQG